MISFRFRSVAGFVGISSSAEIAFSGAEPRCFVVSCFVVSWSEGAEPRPGTLASAGLVGGSMAGASASKSASPSSSQLW